MMKEAPAAVMMKRMALKVLVITAMGESGRKKPLMTMFNMTNTAII